MPVTSRKIVLLYFLISTSLPKTFSINPPSKNSNNLPEDPG